LTKKLEKRSSKSSNKGLANENSDQEFHSREEYDEEPKEKKNLSLGLMSIKEIKSLIADAGKAYLEGGSHITHLYSKPYTKRINTLRMSHEFQRPKFHQFDSEGNSKQHIVYFIETCNNVGTEGDLLVKQFV